MRSTIGRIVVALSIATAAVTASAAAAGASTTATTGGAKIGGCGPPQAGPWQPTTGTTAAAGQATAATAPKPMHATQTAVLQALSAANVTHDAHKKSLIASGQTALDGRPATAAQCRPTSARTAYTTNAVVPYLHQYPQKTNYFCGPATVSEFSATVPGPSPFNLDQWSVASYMGTTSSAGTSVSGEVNGLNHYVGVPDFGWNYYGFVWMSDPPSAGQRAAFEANLDMDVSQSSPVAGDAYEVAYGPHLVGHPASQTLYHWFEIGGRNGSSTLYADSATSVWSGVPAFSWYNTYTLETILGGFGYIW